MREYLHTPAGLSDLRPLLSRWQELNIQYASDWKWKDCPWWYNERASVGLLAAAAWQVGLHALEEYATDKRYRKGKYRGRGDLYFRIGGKAYIAEAKFEWLAIGSGARPPTKRLSDVLANVRKSVVDIDGTRGFRRLGMLFLTPHYPGHEIERHDEALDRCESALRSIRHHAAAWSFPQDAGKLIHGNQVHPGPALLVLA